MVPEETGSAVASAFGGFCYTFMSFQKENQHAHQQGAVCLLPNIPEYLLSNLPEQRYSP